MAPGIKRLGLKRDGVSAMWCALEAQGVVLLNDVADDSLLIEVAEELGTVIEPGAGMKGGAHDGRIYSVESRPSGANQRDRHGNLILSTTTLKFPLHTDGYNGADPPRFVLLMRGDQSNDQTESFTCNAFAAIADLPPDIVEILKRPFFPSARGSVALLEQSKGIERLRFNRHEIDNWATHDAGLFEEAAVRAVDALEGALIRHQERFRIEYGQCLVLDNWRSCHGRGTVAAGSKRVLRRVWVL
jgi:alpha-ketoglutarate-dependent taurine dioxygenase